MTKSELLMWVLRVRDGASIDTVEDFVTRMSEFCQQAADLKEQNTLMRLQFDNLYRKHAALLKRRSIRQIAA